MKAAAGIVLLLLLLCNMLGLSVAVLCLEKQYAVAPPVTDQSEILIVKSYAPYAHALEDNDIHEGLYRIHDQLYNVIHQVRQNDTLYVTLQVNASAWQRFSELSDMMQEVNTDNEATNPVSRTIKILNDLLKVYLPIQTAAFECDKDFESLNAKSSFPAVRNLWDCQVSKLQSPPPEIV